MIVGVLLLVVGWMATRGHRTLWVHARHHEWVAERPGGDPIDGSIEDITSSTSIDDPISVAFFEPLPFVERIPWLLRHGESPPELVEYRLSGATRTIDGATWFEIEPRGSEANEE